MTCQIDDFHACKAPGEALDYEIDYSGVMALSDPTDSIASSSWTIAICGSAVAAVTITGFGNNGSKADVWLSTGGKPNTYYRVTNTITTAGQRTYVRTILIEIRNK